MKNTPLLHRAYLGALFIKGFDGAVETLVGVGIAIAGPQRLYATILSLTTPELDDDRPHRVIEAIQHGASGLAQASQLFIVTYLLVHGVLKLGIVITLLRGERWIFPIASLILSGFILYMGYHLAHRWSGWLFAFALFDLLTLGLVLNEWTNPPQSRR